MHLVHDRGTLTGLTAASRPSVRVGDGERDMLLKHLTEHYVEGRLTLTELQARSDVVMRSVTVGDLQEVLNDLPQPAPRVSESWIERAQLLWRWALLAPWALFSVVFVLIWAMADGGYFWPAWPILGWGMGVAATGVVARVVPRQIIAAKQARLDAASHAHPLPGSSPRDHRARGA